MTYEQWVEKYLPEKNNIVATHRDFDGFKFEHWGPELDYVNKIWKESPGRVWTLIAADNGGLYISDGYHLVNRDGYFITGVPHEGDFIEIEVGEPDDEED